MQFVQLAALEPPDDRPPPHPQREQLLPSNHAVLPLCQPRHLMVKRSSVKLSTSVVPKFTLSLHTGDVEAAGRTCGARFVAIQRRKAQKRLQPAVAASGFDPFQ